jgi:hypothetical protein
MGRPAAGLAALLITGCGIFQPGVPAWVANRQPLPACAAGAVEAESPEADAGQQCLLDAFLEGRGAELITAGEMETGDPLVSYVRIHENGTVEMFLNLGDDPLAPGAWERFRCEDVIPSGPSDVQAPGSFALDACEQLPVP